MQTSHPNLRSLQGPEEDVMTRAHRFPISSEQCELLLALEEGGSVAGAARLLARDQTAVLRQLQHLAETFPVVAKHGGKWVLTPLGGQVSGWSRASMTSLTDLLFAPAIHARPGRVPTLGTQTVLLLVNVQKGVAAATMGPRNNLQAETTIATILTRWRAEGWPVAFAQHASPGVGSALSAGSLGHEPKDALGPIADELVVTKSANSAFVGTPLAELLSARGWSTVVIVGFATNYCVDATARTGRDLGFRCFVVADATATFDLTKADGSILRAQELHDVALASMDEEFATVIASSTLLARS